MRYLTTLEGTYTLCGMKPMPAHKVHKYADRLLLGKSYPQVHKSLDFPYILFGRKHRQYFHTLKEAFPIGYMVSGEAKGALSGALHVWLDLECSKDKDFKLWLEWAVKEDEKINRRISRLAKKMRQERAKRKT